MSQHFFRSRFQQQIHQRRCQSMLSWMKSAGSKAWVFYWKNVCCCCCCCWWWWWWWWWSFLFLCLLVFLLSSTAPKLDGHEDLWEKLLYFEWSPPWHVGWRLSGEGCHWEYNGKNGEFENIDFRFPWLGDTSEMGFGHDVPFLNYSDRLPHPSDLCQPDRVRWG